jgi:hypothetical protein
MNSKFKIQNWLWSGLLAILNFSFLIPPARSAHVYFNLSDFGLDTAAHSNRLTRLIPQSTPRADGSTIISSETRTFTNSPTATFLASNLVTGVYKVEIPGRWTTTLFNILVPDDSLTYNANTLITTTNSMPSASVGYSQSAADARFANLTNVFPAGATNFSVAFTNTFSTTNRTLLNYIVPATNAAYHIHANVVGWDVANQTNAASYALNATFYADPAWTVFQIGTNQFLSVREVDDAWNAQLSASFSNILLRVTSQSTNALWRAHIQVLRTP